MLHRRRLLNFNYKRKLTFEITFVFFPSLVAFVLQAQSPCRTGSEGTESHLTTLQQNKEVAMLCEESMITTEARSALSVCMKQVAPMKKH
jgi:hypothetical protein